MSHSAIVLPFILQRYFIFISQTNISAKSRVIVIRMVNMRYNYGTTYQRNSCVKRTRCGKICRMNCKSQVTHSPYFGELLRMPNFAGFRKAAFGVTATIDGNLKEFHDYQGHTATYQTRKYGYFSDVVEYPIIMPVIINSEHHTPLVRQGIFGASPVNLVKAVTVSDGDGNLNFSRQYTYKFEDARIIGYTESTSYSNTAFSNSIPYSVNWAEK